MVTGLVEVGRRKCHQYWPNQVGVPEQFGSFILELISEQSQARRLIFFTHLPDMLFGLQEIRVADWIKTTDKAHYTVRDIKIKLGTESRTVKQMQYHSWPDHGVPGKNHKFC